LNLKNFELEDSNSTLVSIKPRGLEPRAKGRSIKRERKETGGEWISLMHYGMGEYIGNPVEDYRAWPPGNWDSLKLDKTAGHFMICDEWIRTCGIKWIDVKDGMIIRIRARFPHWKSYEYLEADSYSADIWLNHYLNWSYSQKWKVHLDKTDTTVAFENMNIWGLAYPHPGNGYYLGARDDKHDWLELKSKKKIKWTVSAHVGDDNNSENETIMAL